MKTLKLLFYNFLLLIVVSSCYQDSGEFNKINSITIIADSSEKLTGQEIIFTVTTDSGLDITDDSQIIVDGSAISGQGLTSAIEKSFEVKATYKGVASNTITVSFKQLVESFAKRVLIEDFTGTWCGNCTRVSWAIELLKLQTDKAVTIGIHNGPNSGSFDPYHFPTPELDQLIQLPGYPTARLNRKAVNWTYPQVNHLNQALALTQGDIVKLGLAMNSTLTGNTINLDVKVKFVKDYTNLKLVVYALENNLIYNQENYSSYYGGVNPVVNFKHDHVLRATFTALLGDAIPNSETVNGATFVRNFTVPVPATITNPASNMEFVAFIVDENNNAINVRKSEVGENQLFEINP